MEIAQRPGRQCPTKGGGQSRCMKPFPEMVSKSLWLLSSLVLALPTQHYERQWKEASSECHTNRHLAQKPPFSKAHQSPGGKHCNFPKSEQFSQISRDFVVITPHPSHISPSVMDHTGEACSINGAIPWQRNGVGARINSFSTAEVFERFWLPFIFHKSLFCLDNWQFKSKRRILSFYPAVGYCAVR